MLVALAKVCGKQILRKLVLRNAIQLTAYKQDICAKPMKVSWYGDLEQN